MVPDEFVDAVVNTIQRCARTGKPGDGRIFVIDIATTVKIRTGERQIDNTVRHAMCSGVGMAPRLVGKKTHHHGQEAPAMLHLISVYQR